MNNSLSKKNTIKRIMTPTTYIYFAYNNKKYALYNSEKYSIHIENGEILNISPWEERMLLRYLNYSNTIEDAKRKINQYINCEYKDFSFHLRDGFINKFIEDHPFEIINNIENPAHALNGLYSFHIPLLDKTITITDQEEKELIGIVNIYKEKSQRKVSQWFLNYYYQKGINPFSMTEEIKEIAISFTAERGYVVNRGADIEGILTGVAVIWKILLFIVAVPIFIGLIFSLFKVIFS